MSDETCHFQNVCLPCLFPSLRCQPAFLTSYLPHVLPSLTLSIIFTPIWGFCFWHVLLTSGSVDSHIYDFYQLDLPSHIVGAIWYMYRQITEERYQGRWDSNTMADFCWALMRDIPEAAYQRSSKKMTYFMQLDIAWSQWINFLYRVFLSSHLILQG